MDKEIRIQITPEIEKIMSENISEKRVTEEVDIDDCKNCPYHDVPWIRGDRLYCCGYNHENIITSRDVLELYNNCPINHKLKTHKKFIKKYGIIHTKHGGYSSKGSISVVDFSRTTFEWDGNNPDVDWNNVVIFFYNNQKEADIMMELALDYYHRFNLEEEYVPKHCYG